MMAGCAEDPPPYERSELSLQSPQARQVRAMLDRLRQAGPEGLDAIAREGGIDDLSPDQARMLQFALGQLARAREAKLTSLERFGPTLLRAGFEVTTEGKTAEKSMLLLRTPDGTLRWARPN